MQEEQSGKPTAQQELALLPLEIAYSMRKGGLMTDDQLNVISAVTAEALGYQVMPKELKDD